MLGIYVYSFPTSNSVALLNCNLQLRILKRNNLYIYCPLGECYETSTRSHTREITLEAASIPCLGEEQVYR